MRVCIAGGGLAGTLLAWRLARCPEVESVDLLLGAHGADDATEHSGGVVRAYEPETEQRRLAVESLAELRASAVLRDWSAFRETGCVYLRPGDRWLPGALGELEAALPGSVRLLSAGDLATLGWAGLPHGTVGVHEPGAGCISPTGLRRAVLAELSLGTRVTPRPAPLERLVTSADGTVTCWAGGRRRRYDAAVVAAGSWTPRVLVASGLPARGYRTKSVQYTVYRAAGGPPMPFVDETTGLYGRPTDGGGLLLGLATEEWGVVPGVRPLTPGLHARAAELAAARLPGLRLGPVLASANATDCYCRPPVLALRAVRGTRRRVWTFTGGSGGSAKTALAASRLAADHLVRSTTDSNRLDRRSANPKVSQP